MVADQQPATEADGAGPRTKKQEQIVGWLPPRSRWSAAIGWCVNCCSCEPVTGVAAAQASGLWFLQEVEETFSYSWSCFLGPISYHIVNCFELQTATSTVFVRFQF